MTDARGLTTFRSWIQSLTLVQELSVLAGVFLFFAGLAVDTMLVRVILLAASASAIAYAVVSLRAKRSLNIIDPEDLQPEFTDEEPQPPMAKLIFDDLREPGSVRREEPPMDPMPEPTTVAAPDVAEPTVVHSRPEPPVRQYEFQLSDFFETEEAPAADDGPRAEFRYLMKKVLTVVKDVHFAHTVALFWVNREKQQLVLENHVTEAESFTPNRRQEIGVDVVSQIASSGKPQILTSVNATSLPEMLPYYGGAEPVRTFVGVPIFYARTMLPPKDPVAVLTVDCKGEDAYGPETLAQLGQFTKLISALIQSYTDKYDLLLDSEVLRSITRLREQLRLDFTVHNTVRSLVEETSRVVPWDYVSAVVYDESRKIWVLQHVLNRMNDPYVPAGHEIDLHRSLAGQVIQYSVPKIVDHLASVNLPRFYPAERTESAGSLVAIPLTSVRRCYGVLVVESKDVRTYSEADARLIQKLADTASWALEILTLTDVATNYVATDEVTGVATRRHFAERMQEEVQRAGDFASEVALVMIAIDHLQTLAGKYGADAVDAVLQAIGRLIRTSVRPYDVVGRFDANRFAALLVETTTNEASLWAEKLRKNVAGHIMNVNGKSFSVTISVGVSGASSELSDMVLLENADRVLKKAVEAGGNIVRVF
jgi:diguanylate cyclase (GGDEF)-like protein